MTGAEALRLAVHALTAAEVDDPSGDARRLLLHALGPGAARHGLAAALNSDLTPAVLEQFEATIAARGRRQPVSQIVGGRDFWKYRFTVTRDTLDPRPDTETLIEQALKLPWTSVLDLGTGTGAILLSLLAERPGATGLGTDLSPAALDVARRNAEALDVTADFQISDWFADVAGQFDLIVSNPPYIAQDEMAELAPEVCVWEPEMALTDGADGLSAYRRIAAGARNHLATTGHLLCEIGHAQGEAVSAIFRSNWADAQVFADLNGRDRVILARYT